MTNPPRSTAPAAPPVAILGVAFDSVTMEGALARIEEMIASRRPHYVVTANVDFLVQARDDLELRRILHDAHLVVADGMPLVWASRWLGNPVPERVTGSGMAPLLLARAEARGWRVFFLGGTEQSVAQAATNTRAKHPRLQLVGAYSPPFKPLIEMDHDDLLRRLREARPDILLVAFGCPKQEKWLNMHYRTAGVPVGIGVGATIDFLAGTVTRAPLWMQRTGLEWVFRLLQEPRRLFRRYVTGLWVFGCAILRQLWGLRAKPEVSPATPAVQSTMPPDSGALVVTPPARFTARAVRATAATWEQVPQPLVDVLIAAGGLIAVDSTGVAALMRLQKALRERGRHLLVVAPSPPLTRAFELMNISGCFTQAPDLPAALSLLAARRREFGVVVASGPNESAPSIAWQGEITAVNVEEVARATEPCLATASGRVVVDLSGVRFLDSSGVGLMVRLKKLARTRNADLAFVSPTAGVRNVARLLRLEKVLFADTP